MKYSDLYIGKNIKTLAIISVASLFLAALSFLVLPKPEKIDINIKKNYDISDIGKLSIESDLSDIKVIKEDRADLEVSVIGESFKKQAPKLVEKKDGNNLELSLMEKKSIVFNFNFMSGSRKITVKMPNTYNKSLELDTSAGDIEVEGLKLSALSCDIDLGSLNIKKLEVQNLYIDSSSGDIIGDKIHTEKTEIKASLGEINLNNFKGDFKGKASSGDISANYEEFVNNKIDINTDLGNAKLELPKNASFKLEASVSLGSINNDFSIKVDSDVSSDRKLKGIVENGSNLVKIDTSSGDIDIVQKN